MMEGDIQSLPNNRVDVEKPLWSQATFIGRLKHFAWMTDFRTVVVSSNKLLEAKTLLEQYKSVLLLLCLYNMDVVSFSTSCSQNSPCTLISAFFVMTRFWHVSLMH